MKRLILGLVLCVSSWCAVARASAEEYLLKLEAIEYVGVPEDDAEAEGRVLYSIEVVTQPHAVFHSKVSIDSQSLTLTGRLQRSDRGAFSVQIDFVDSKDFGITITKKDGTREPLPTVTSLMTTIGAELNERVTVGGIESRTRRSGKPVEFSLVRYVLTLTRFEST